MTDSDDDLNASEREAERLGRCGPLRWGGPCWLMPGHRGPHHCYPEDVDAVVAAAVEQARADAWDEGFNAGFQVGSEAAVRREPITRHDNPYRAALAGPEAGEDRG